MENSNNPHYSLINEENIESNLLECVELESKKHKLEIKLRKLRKRKQPDDSDEDDKNKLLMSSYNQQIKEYKKKIKKLKKFSVNSEKSDESETNLENIEEKQEIPKLDDTDDLIYKTRIGSYFPKLKLCKNKTILKIPKTIWKKLYSFQKDGVKFLFKLYLTTNGGILADDMGLGKTIQVISLLSGLIYPIETQDIKKIELKNCYLKEEVNYKSTGVLIITPVTLIRQWWQEFINWTPNFRISIFHNKSEDKLKLALDCVKRNNGILLTSYETAARHIDLLMNHTWFYCILDEGHKLRNSETYITKTLKLINSENRIILSGTPIQNNLKELWSIFDFACPGLLGNIHQFNVKFAEVIKNGCFSNRNFKTKTDAAQATIILKNLTKPYFLRRTKEEVKFNINLTKKSESVVLCSMSKTQYNLYTEEIKNSNIQELIKNALIYNPKSMLNPNRIDREVYKRIVTGMGGKVLKLISNLRNICNHPCIYQNSEFDTIYDSGKLIVTLDFMKKWRQKNIKFVLFSQTRRMLSIIENAMKLEGFNLMRLDGKVPVDQRSELLQRFDTDELLDGAILTTRVGGIGLNLTRASRVIIFDPDWNPMVDTQARDRSWRIGQLNNVRIYRLIVKHSIEEKIFQRQIFKVLLTKRFLDSSDFQKVVKANDLKDLFILPNAYDENDTEIKNLDKNEQQFDDHNLLENFNHLIKKSLEIIKKEVVEENSEIHKQNFSSKEILKGLNNIQNKAEETSRNTEPDLLIIYNFCNELRKLLKSNNLTRQQILSHFKNQMKFKIIFKKIIRKMTTKHEALYTLKRKYKN